MAVVPLKCEGCEFCIWGWNVVLNVIIMSHFLAMLWSSSSLALCSSSSVRTSPQMNSCAIPQSDFFNTFGDNLRSAHKTSAKFLLKRKMSWPGSVMQRSSPQLRLCAQLGDRTVKLHYLITRTCINLHRYSACLHFTPYARTLKTLLQNPPDITRTSLSSNLLLFLNIDTIHSFENTHQSLKNALSLRKSCDSGFPLAARTLFQPRFKLPRIPRRARCVGKHSLARSFKYTFERGRLMINLTRKDQRFDRGARQTSRIKCKFKQFISHL